LRHIPIDERRRMRVGALADALARDRAAGVVPVAVVATAGTTLTGAVDPLAAIADVCAAHDVWLHVDGAYGLPAAAVPETAGLVAGLHRADSATVDAHKWLYLPKACGVVLVRRRAELAAALAHEEDYFPHEHGEPHAVDITFEYSRPFRALKLWLAFRAHGAAAFRAAISENLRQARLLFDQVEARPELETLCGPPPLTIVPFRHLGGDDLDLHNAALAHGLQQDGRVWVAPARVDGRTCLRPCIVNFRTTDDDVRALVELACELGAP
jgi:aromatic-L-amino-acid decarboxylase